MKRFYVCVLLLMCLGYNFAQDVNYKQAERFMRSKSGNLVFSASVRPQFIKETDKFWYVHKTNDGEQYYYVDPKSKTHKELFNRMHMAREISQITHKPVNSKDLKLQNIKFKDDEKTFKFNVDTFYFEYNIHTNYLSRYDTIIKKDEKKKDEKPTTPSMDKYTSDSTYVVYAKEHNLYVMSLKDSVETQLTTDGEEYFSYSEREADTTKTKTPARISWLGESKKFYVTRSDRRKVKNLYVVNVLPERPHLNNYKYVMAGDEDVSQYSLYIYDIETKEEIKVPVEKWKDQTISVFTDGKKSERLYFVRKKRTCDELELCKVNTNTGEVKVLIHEIDKPYFNNDFFNISIINEGKDIIWWSERTGHGQYYHYNGEGELLNTISTGDWTAGKIEKIDTVGRIIYFGGYGQVKGECPYYARMNKAHVDGKFPVKMLTPEMATHEVHFSKSARYFVDNYSRADLEPKSVLRDNEGKVIMELATHDLSRLYQTGWKMPEPITIKAADGITDLYGFMWKPIDFDSTKTYPIISYVYPGPQTEAIPLRFTVSAVYNQSLAQLGFIVVTFGHRGGSPMRDKWYHTFGHGNLRDYPLADDKHGIEQLADRYSFIDISKVGIFGHSGGGFMSTAAICTYPDFYSAAVSSAGNHDNNIYNQWWGETHHGVREVEKNVSKTVKDTITGKDTTINVKETSFQTKIPTNIELAGRLKGHLMLVTGDIDNNVHPGNTLRMANALIRAGKNFDFVILPGVHHSFGGIQGEFYERKMWYHFVKHLKEDYSSETFTDIDEYNRL